MRPTTNRIRLLLLVLLLAATSAGAWVQLNLRDLGGSFQDADLELSPNNANCCGGNPTSIMSPSITFRREQDGTADVGAAATQTAWLASFTAINDIASSNATATDGGTFNNTTGNCSENLLVDGVNNVYFMTNNDCGGGGLAFASFAFFTASGNIVDCDIVFDDTAAGGITWSVTTPGNPNDDLGADTFDIQEVMNQEVQHCFGFEHTPVAGLFNSSGHQVSGFFSLDFSQHASLYPFATGTIQGRTFQPDDIAAFTGEYPGASPNSGTITGSVTMQGGGAVKGAHVVAVSTASPNTPVVGALSGVDQGQNGTGNFSIRGVPPGNYFVRVEPMIGTVNVFTVPNNTFFTGDITNFAPEFWSGGAETNADAMPFSTDAAMVTVADGGTFSNVNIIVNSLAPFAQGGANDTHAMARVISTNTFREAVDTTTAQASDPLDPMTSCFGTPLFSAWYTFTAPSNGTITVSTEGSAYDTGLAAFTGTPGSFVEVPGACNDDIDFGPTFNLQSMISFNATSGTTYSFVVGDVGFQGPPEFILVLNFTFTSAVNAAPVAMNDSFTTSVNTQLNVAAPGVLANDMDADGDPIMVDTGFVGTQPANGTLMLNADGSFTYTPNMGFSGMDTFTYQATDGTSNSNTATVTITVEACNFTWDAGGDMVNWEDTQNWDPDGQPGMTDVACIDGTSAVTHSAAAGSNTIRVLRHTSSAALTITGGTLSVLENSEVGTGGLVMTSGTLDVSSSATLDFNGMVDFQGGTMSGGGGLFQFDAGATFSTAANKTFDAAQVFLPNGQTITWTDGAVRLNNGTSFINSGTFDAQGDDSLTITNSFGSEAFINNGTFTKSAGAGFTIIGPLGLFFSNAGTVNVNSGTLVFCGASGSSTGTFNVAMNTFLSWGGGCGTNTFDHNSGSSVTGAGTMSVGTSDSTVNFNAGSSLSSRVTVGEGTLNLATGGTVTVPSVNFAGAGTINANSALNIGATGLGWSCGTFGGTQTITLNGPGSIVDGACGARVLAGGNFVNNNTITWSSGDIVFNSATAQLTNNGAFNIQFDDDIVNGGGGGAIVNQATGTVTKSVSGGVTQVGVPFLNGGNLNINSGTLNFTSGFTQQGNGLTTVSGGTLASTGLLTFDGGVLRGDGTVNGNVDINSASLVPGINAPGVLNQTGILNINSTGAFTVDLGGTTPGTGAGFHDQYNVTGAANLAIGSTLNVALNSFTPMIGDTFDILTATTRTGQFTNLFLPDVSPNSFQVNYLATGVQLEVVPNAAPNAVDDNATTNEDTFVDIDVLANDTDTDGPNPLSVLGFTQGGFGTVTDQGGGVLRYTPSMNVNNVTIGGTDSFFYDVTDGVNTVMAVMVTVDITPVNDAPIFSLDVVGMGGPEDGFSSANAVTSGMAPGPMTATDEAGQTLDFIVMNDNPGLFSVQPDIDTTTGDMTWTLAPDANGTAILTITLMDNGGTADGGDDSTTAGMTFTLDVSEVNDAPVVGNDMFTVGQDSMNNDLDVLANDFPGPFTATDEAGQTLTINNIGNFSNGGMAAATNGTISYTPMAGFTGMETFTYDACDNGTTNAMADPLCTTATVTVTVVPNLPPTPMADSDTTLEDTLVDIDVLANDTDPENDPLTVVAFTQGAMGTVTDQGGGVLRYTPNLNFNGMDSFTYDVSDGTTTVMGVMVTVTVTAVNDEPSFTGGPNQMVAEDAGPQVIMGWATMISAGPTDEQMSQTVQFNVTNNTNAALFSAAPAVDPFGQLSYTPAANANGSANITIVLMDTGGTANGGDDTSASYTFTITVTPVNDPPVITAGPTSNPVSPIPGNTSTGASVAFSITASDVDGDPLTFAWTGGCGTSSVEDPTLACPFGMGLMVNVTVSDPSMTTAMGSITIDVTDYSITAACQGGMPPCNSPTMATILAGQAVDFNLTATGINGTYAANITYSCMNLPAQTTCTFTPSATVPNAPPGGTVTMLRIQTTAPGFAQLHAPSSPSRPAGPPFLALFLTVPGLALLGLALAGGRGKRRSLGTLCLLAIVLLMAGVLVGCGSGGDFFTGLGNPGTPTGSHAITIQAQGTGTLQRTVMITVVVQ